MLLLIRRFGQEVLRSRYHAWGYATVFCCLPFLSWVGTVIMGLVTLSKSAKEGVLLVGWISLPLAVLAFFKPLSVMMVIIATSGHFLVWCLSVVLRRYTWQRVLQVATVFGLVTVVLLHGFYPDLTTWWAGQLKVEWKQLEQQTDLTIPAVNPSVVAPYMTGLQLLALIGSALLNLVLARGWQAILYNPGGLRRELHLFRLDKVTTIVSVLCLAASFGFELGGLKDTLPLLALPCFLAGLHLVHSELLKANGLLILLFYAALLWFFMTLASVLMLVAVLDSWFDLRRLKKRYSK